MITVTVIAITAAIRYHNVHVVMMMRMSFWRRHLHIVAVRSLQRSRQPSTVVWDVVLVVDDGVDDMDDVRRWTSNVVVFRCLSS